MENDKKENCLILGITLLLVLSGIALRLYGLRTRNLEYDEIWTFAHYVKLPLREIFTELAVPNNHPLNTLFIKYSDAPITALAVKDRVTGHNPLAPVYLAQGYYHNKFYPQDKEQLNPHDTEYNPK